MTVPRPVPLKGKSFLFPILLLVLATMVTNFWPPTRTGASDIPVSTLSFLSLVSELAATSLAPNSAQPDLGRTFAANEARGGP